MSLELFEGPGSTPSRRRFWNDARNAVVALRKVAGRNVTVNEHPGKGTVINVADTSSRRPPTAGGSPSGATGACCFNDGSCSIQTAANCSSLGGTYQGNGTNCSPNPCPGLACPPEFQSSGLLTVGATYQIFGYNAGDNFTNVGASSNATGVIFVASGTTPTVWTHGSTLIVYIIHVAISGVSLCSCIDSGSGTSFQPRDGHFPGGTDAGINSTYDVPAGGPGWQRSLVNATLTDPYFHIAIYNHDSICTTLDAFNLVACTITVTCSSGFWTVDVFHSGFGDAFQGTGAGTVAAPIINALTCGSGSPSGVGVGTGGQAVISLT